MKQHAESSRAAPVKSSRRDFLKWGGTVAAGSALAAAAAPVHAGEDNTIRLALIGCGGRGGGAVGNALAATGGPVKLHVMADVFEDRLNRSYTALSEKFGDRIDVPAERQFLGFDAYRKAIDCLRPGDVALLTTRAYPRATHLDFDSEAPVHDDEQGQYPAPIPGDWSEV